MPRSRARRAPAGRRAPCSASPSASWRRTGRRRPVRVDIHGLVGALLLGPVGWFLGLVLIREAIRANIEDQRAVHDARVREAKRQLVEQLQASGHAVPAALQDAVGDRRQLGPGS